MISPALKTWALPVLIIVLIVVIILLSNHQSATSEPVVDDPSKCGSIRCAKSQTCMYDGQQPYCQSNSCKWTEQSNASELPFPTCKSPSIGNGFLWCSEGKASSGSTATRDRHFKAGSDVCTAKDCANFLKGQGAKATSTTKNNCSGVFRDCDEVLPQCLSPPSQLPFDGDATKVCRGIDGQFTGVLCAQLNTQCSYDGLTCEKSKDAPLQTSKGIPLWLKIAGGVVIIIVVAIGFIYFFNREKKTLPSPTRVKAKSLPTIYHRKSSSNGRKAQSMGGRPAFYRDWGDEKSILVGIDGYTI